MKRKVSLRKRKGWIISGHFIVREKGLYYNRYKAKIGDVAIGWIYGYYKLFS
jgi:hypothetical protein